MRLDLRNIQQSENDRKREIVLPSEVTEDLAYLCGILAGDGYLAPEEDKKHKYNLICCGHPVDEKEFYIQIICPLFYKLFNINPKLKSCSDGTIRIHFGSKAIHSLLTQVIGLPKGKKYLSLKIPDVFLSDKKFTISFIRGVFDTDGCISFKKRGRDYPYYPVICLSQKSRKFVEEISEVLKSLGFRFSKPYHYKVKDERFKKGYSIINRIELLGEYNLSLWMQTIGFFSPKHLSKINGRGITHSR